MRCAFILFLLVPAVVAVRPAAAKSTPTTVEGPPAVRAVRLAGPVVVDGVLSEPVWQGGEAASDFHQRDPSEGAPPSQRTEVRVAYDDEAVYIGARMSDDAPDSILARLARRDVSIAADRFTVYLDPFHDHRSGYYFAVNAAGTLYDGTLSNDGWENDSWDGVWQGKARVDGAGWTAELRIPFSQLRFQKSARYVWGIDFFRAIPRRAEQVYLVYQPKQGSGFVSRFPDLTGIENVNPGRSIEVFPYATGKAAYQQHLPADPFHDGSRYTPSVGGDLRMGVGSRLTLNATVNPDFGQVEVDPAVVNLSDLESYFPEKRPFFVEGASNFGFGQNGANNYWGFNWPEPTFFYSRRIGRAPQGAVPDSEFSDAPLGTSILGAAKLTGKLSQTWNLGALSALTGRESARLWGGGGASRSEIEPLTYYGAAHALKELPGRSRGIGFMGTAAVRSFDQAPLRDQLNSASYMAGVDGWLFLDANKDWVISGWSALSQIRGSAARMTAVQQSSRHYFQRPDADHVSVDPGATSLTGFGSRYWLNRQNGDMIFNAALGLMSPKFDVNDVGYHTRSDVINAHVGGGRKWTSPTRHRRYQELIGAVYGVADFGGHVTSAGLFAEGYTEWLSNYALAYQAMYFPTTLNNSGTRGGPLMRSPAGFDVEVRVESDSRKKVYFSIESEVMSRPASGSHEWLVRPTAEWKPASNVTLSLGPEYDRVVGDAQYLDTIADSLAVATYGHRYVFARLDQTTLSANLRLNWAFSPALSLQLYVQPLLSSGRFTDYKELARPRSYEFRRYVPGVEYDPQSGVIDPDGPAAGGAPFQPDRPSFTSSLRGNAVLRWEFMPGSAFYLVWTQERAEDEPLGDFEIGSSARRLLRTPADNIFMAKVTYYLGL